MTVALILITDGRDAYHEECLASLDEALPRNLVDQVVAVDDPHHKLGFAGAVQAAWEQVETDWCFHVEADFTFNEPIDLPRMIGVLERQPQLAQIVLKRQPVNELEQAAGGIIEQEPEAFTQCREGMDSWTEHRKFWSTNPSVYSSRYCRMGWPQVKHSEGIFTHRLLKDPHLRFAFWGRKTDPPRVHHIGEIRTGRGY